MHVHDIDAFLERRLLLNYRVDPDVVATILPKPFSPRLVNGYAFAGICLIHMSDVRPKGFPAAIGIEVQGSAHRIAVSWTDRTGTEQHGVCILRRDSGSRIVGIIGRRSLAEHSARFLTSETDEDIALEVKSQDGRGSVRVKARFANDLATSVLGTAAEARDFFEHGGPGYTRVSADKFTGVALSAASWDMAPLEIADARSVWLEDAVIFPTGTAALDSALVMRRTNSSWRSVPMLAA